MGKRARKSSLKRPPPSLYTIDGSKYAPARKADAPMRRDVFDMAARIASRGTSAQTKALEDAVELRRNRVITTEQFEQMVRDIAGGSASPQKPISVSTPASLQDSVKILKQLYPDRSVQYSALASQAFGHSMVFECAECKSLNPVGRQWVVSTLLPEGSGLFCSHACCEVGEKAMREREARFVACAESGGHVVRRTEVYADTCVRCGADGRYIRTRRQPTRAADWWE